MKGMVLVSEIGAYLRCPRLVYFRSLHRDDYQKIIDVRYLSHLILKELAFTYHRAAASDDATETLHVELDRITCDLPAIYRVELSGMDYSMIPDAASEIDIDAIGSRITEVTQTTGRDELLTKIAPCAVEHTMYSDALGIAGAPDKLVIPGDRGHALPYIIRTGAKPDQGVWKPDRLQITAYAMLVEETFGTVVDYGFVEYARFFDLREVVIRSGDRRRVLELRNRIRKIKDGRMPDRPREGAAPCEFCAFSDDCDTHRSLASKFF